MRMQAQDTDDIGVADKAACGVSHRFWAKMLSTFLAFGAAVRKERFARCRASILRAGV